MFLDFAHLFHIFLLFILFSKDAKISTIKLFWSLVRMKQISSNIIHCTKILHFVDFCCYSWMNNLLPQISLWEKKIISSMSVDSFFVEGIPKIALSSTKESDKETFLYIYLLHWILSIENKRKIMQNNSTNKNPKKEKTMLEGKGWLVTTHYCQFLRVAPCVFCNKNHKK
jgi:hypothetical protein